MDVDAFATGVASSSAAGPLTDPELVKRIRTGESHLFEILMRRHNQRLYRAVRAVLGAEGEVEDVMQQAYMNAFAHLDQFESRSEFSTWLTRIALNEAFARRRRLRQARVTTATPDDGGTLQEPMDAVRTAQPDPERQAYARELHRVLEHAVDALPATYRVVFMLRDVEGLSTAETGKGLGLREEAVKTRLHRARAMIRRAVTAQIGAVAADTFQFHALRCDRVVDAVLGEIVRGSAPIGSVTDGHGSDGSRIDADEHG
jgi:RNA polymerase sigma-70 factor, ECF subfamily